MVIHFYSIILILTFYKYKSTHAMHRYAKKSSCMTRTIKKVGQYKVMNANYANELQNIIEHAIISFLCKRFSS